MSIYYKLGFLNPTLSLSLFLFTLFYTGYAHPRKGKPGLRPVAAQVLLVQSARGRTWIPSIRIAQNSPPKKVASTFPPATGWETLLTLPLSLSLPRSLSPSLSHSLTLSLSLSLTHTHTRRLRCQDPKVSSPNPSLGKKQLWCRVQGFRV